MPHFITSHQGEPHVKSDNAAHFNTGVVGKGNYLLPVRDRLAATMIDANTIRILGGDACINGRHVSIDGAYEEYTIENGTPGYKRVDLVVWHIETGEQETLDIRVIKGTETTGTPTEPAYVTGDLNTGSTVVEVPICSVTLNGINPSAPAAKMKELKSLADAWDSISPLSFTNIQAFVPQEDSRGDFSFLFKTKSGLFRTITFTQTGIDYWDMSTHRMIWSNH